MKTILLATACKFWLQDQGSAKRISDLYRYLTTQEFKVFIFFLDELQENDINLMQANYEGIKIFTSSRGLLTVDRQLDAKLFPASTSTKKTLKQKTAKFLPASAVKLIRTLKAYKNRHFPKTQPESNITQFFSQEDRDYFRVICREIEPDWIVVEYLKLAYLIQDLDRFISNRPLTIVDTHDVLYQRYQRFSEKGERSIKITESEEKEWLNLFDVILAIQSQDCETFSRMLPHRRTILVGYVSKIRFHPFQEKPQINITYIASSNASNQRTIAKFLEDVWVQLSQNFSDRITLSIVGGVCSSLNAADLPQNIKLLGWVEDLNSVYQAADIIINPVYFGSGLKIKNVEALCNGKPLVTTTVGAEGLEHGIDRAFLVCDRPEQAIEQLSNLIENPDLRRYLSARAYDFAQNNFTDNKVYRELYEVLTSYSPSVELQATQIAK